MDVLVSQTSVSTYQEIEQLRASLTPLGKWNFDLEDCDRIFRINSTVTQPCEVIGILHEQGYSYYVSRYVGTYQGTDFFRKKSAK